MGSKGNRQGWNGNYSNWGDQSVNLFADPGLKGKAKGMSKGTRRYSPYGQYADANASLTAVFDSLGATVMNGNVSFDVPSDGNVTPLIHDALLYLFGIEAITMEHAKPATSNPIRFHKWFAKILYAKDVRGWKNILWEIAMPSNILEGPDWEDFAVCIDIRDFYILVVTRIHFGNLVCKALDCEPTTVALMRTLDLAPCNHVHLSRAGTT